MSFHQSNLKALNMAFLSKYTDTNFGTHNKKKANHLNPFLGNTGGIFDKHLSYSKQTDWEHHVHYSQLGSRIFRRHHDGVLNLSAIHRRGMSSRSSRGHDFTAIV